jgi:heptosyltransferase III
MNKILFIRSDRLGEFLLTLPAIQLLKANYPQAKTYLLAARDNVELIRDWPQVDYFWEYKSSFENFKGALRLADAIRREKIDCVVTFNPKKVFHAAAFLADVKIRAGYNHKWGFCLNRRIKDLRDLATKHEVEHNIELITPLCPNIFIPSLEIPVDLPETLDFLKPDLGLLKKYVVLHPFSSNPGKKLPPEFWQVLVKRLKKSGNTNVVLIGTDVEKEESRILAEQLKTADICGKLKIRELASFLKYNCRLFIGLDSGPMHLAAALNLPTAGLFTISNPTRWKPFTKTGLTVNIHSSLDWPTAIEKITLFTQEH